MDYDVLDHNLAEFDFIAAKLGVWLADDSPIKNDFEITREFLYDRRSLEEAGWLQKWYPRFKEFYHAIIVVSRLMQAVIIMKDQKRLKSRLKQVLGGSLTQNGTAST